MMRTGWAAAAIGATLVFGGLASGEARAQDAREAQLIGFHQLCDRGDRSACVRFGMMLQQNHDRHDEWRRTHPEFFFFER